MTEDTEKRFQRIMDKLCHSPKPKTAPSSGSGGEIVPQKFRRWEAGSREGVENSTRHVTAATGTREKGPSPCRPWDRGDLTRRLATFKAMTWFGRPKSIDPVNCARRGWVNVEMDTLACEACGSRIMFSTPSSWSLQQVEKAAAVFSLKLDSGHKLLCPWIDNICEESLAFFPPTPAPTLIEGYKERLAALLRLSALPVILSSAIDYMRSPQLENFLAQSSSLAYRVDSGMKLIDGHGIVDLESVSDSDTSSQYYQAHKIISLCGWEPRLLPYAVDCEAPSSVSMKKDKAADSSPELLHGENHGVIVYSSSLSGENDGERSDLSLLNDQYDPASVVLDCKLCGACVGLWTFITTPRPLELFSLIESPEEDGENGLTTGSSDGPASNEKLLSLKLTIAGGPPPTKQNFKPRISLPIVTRHLRAAFVSNGAIRNLVSSNVQDMDQLNTQKSSQHQEGNRSGLFASEASGMLKRKRSENECCTSGGSTSDIQPHLSETINMAVDTLRNEGGCISTCEKGPMHKERCEQSGAKTNEHLQNVREDLVQNSTVIENAENEKSTGTEMGDGIGLQPAEGTCIILDKDDEVHENSSVRGISGICSQDNNGLPKMDISNQSITSQVNQSSHDIALDRKTECHITSVAEVNENLNDKDHIHTGEDSEVHAMQSYMDGSLDEQRVPVQRNISLNYGDAEVVPLHTSRSNPSSSFQWDGTNKFDPIRQHRPFCPWIAPMDNENTPGWKMTLRALVHDRSSSQTVASSSLSDEVNDPLVSVRNLFTSPSKRFKGAG